MVDNTAKLLAIEEIKKLKAAYFRTMDTKAWDEYRSLFVEDALIDTTEAFTPLDAHGQPIEPDLPVTKPDSSLLMRGLDTFMAAQHHFLDGMSTVHHGHTPEIEVISEHEATGIWAMEDKLRWPAGKGRMREMHGYGHYREKYVKVDGRWKIAELKLTRIRIDVIPQ
jgi:hypothetical protein